MHIQESQEELLNQIEELLNNIQKKLSHIGIGKEKTIEWVFRGKVTQIEEELNLNYGDYSIWYDVENNVMNKQMTFPEALLYANRLMNRYSAHKFSAHTKYLNPYDVFNIQNLARQLFT
ncbi:hypothetical protein ATE49_16830 [Elizabethkingia miricola]|uniref:Uncharacterized protein n=1 Tax=Elizabethkingia miricola TaxID=172045 RepID=A0ABY3NFJ4_ELIMR|nr:hypothetical protein [Elizabethkingia miricola]OBS11145.1 hypothetical protein ATE49_16830 [Elizabethkingia miricola]TYO91766.1 hypothetical protein LX74_02012 [Elizabethkingia miricola]